MTVNLSVIILTRNEEANIAQAVGSVSGWARNVFVLDSHSTDSTVEIARGLGCQVALHAFVHYGTQRNHALDHFPIDTEWVLFLDADEWLPDALKEEIDRTIESRPEENGFFLCFKLIWMGRWIRRGYYPTWILRLFRKGTARCEDRSVNEHLKLSGKAGRLSTPFVHEDRKRLSRWIAKHDDYARREARELLRRRRSGEEEDQLPARLFGSQAERVRWLRHWIWNRMPPLVRPFIYFSYRYIFRLGFLDGREALVFHFLQALWFPMLIDAYYLELRAAGAGAEEKER